MLCECPYFFFLDSFYPAAPPSTPPFFQQAFSPSPAAGERWQVENEPVGRAILSQSRHRDDSGHRLNSLSQLPWNLCVNSYVQNMWKACRLLSVSSLCSFAMSKNTRAEESAV